MNEPACESGDHPRRSFRPPNGEDLEKAASLFRALGDVSRLRILTTLAQSEACVTELAEHSSESLSTVSQRLRVLRGEKLVIRRRQGKHINYALADQHVADLVQNALAHAGEGRARRRGAESISIKETEIP